MDRAGRMTPEDYFFLNAPNLPAPLQVGEITFQLLHSSPLHLILEAADLETELRYNVFQLLVYFENGEPFTAHFKAPSSFPDFQTVQGAWQAAHVNKYQPVQKLDSRSVPNCHVFELVYPKPFV